MQKLQLFISGTRVDLFKDESVSITQTIQNIKGTEKSHRARIKLAISKLARNKSQEGPR